jgi:hypothetical protein
MLTSTLLLLLNLPQELYNVSQQLSAAESWLESLWFHGDNALSSSYNCSC